MSDFFWICILSIFLMIIGFWVVRRNDGKLRILMYHKVLPQGANMLTVTTTQLEQQLQYLQSAGYEFISIPQLLNLSSPPSNGILLTFDDAYLNNLEHAYPILKKYGACATIFVPSAYVGHESEWDLKPSPLLSIEQLRHLDHEVFDLALHTHTHPNFADLSLSQMQQEISNNIRFFRDNNLEYVPALAYPYGGRPKDKALKARMKMLLSQMGITVAFRIGNRLNDWPISNRYELQRLDIRGTDSLGDFKRKVQWGKFI